LDISVCFQSGVELSVRTSKGIIKEHFAKFSPNDKPSQIWLIQAGHSDNKEPSELFIFQPSFCT